MPILPVPYYRKNEEILNVATHAVGFLLSVIGFVWLIVRAWAQNDPWYLAAYIIYGASLILLYAASTLYHYSHKKQVRRILNLLDHSAIYLLIAGTYTPFCLIALRNRHGWWLFAAIWTLAALGVVFKLRFSGRLHRLSTLLYLLMGWLAVLSIRPLIDNLPTESLFLMLSGGVAYTIGAVFYLFKRMQFQHAIFHIWVLLGSVLHYFSILKIQ